ncbi:hypothetical protein KAU18_06850 [Candidatus Bathyarchaeota archaeon]|nr:hypothetical protein [Candidatus Bathyarchaeota archaeon]
MVTLDQIIYVLPLLGIMVSILYYAMVLRNSNRTRAAQLFMSLHSEMSSMESMARLLDTMYMEWEDYADFERKYGSDNNPKAYLNRVTLWNAYNNYGVLLKKGLIDPEMVYDANGAFIIMFWEKWRPIIIEQRIRYMGPNYLEHWEHLVKVMRSIQERRGVTWEPPETGFKFVE